MVDHSTRKTSLLLLISLFLFAAGTARANCIIKFAGKHILIRGANCSHVAACCPDEAGGGCTDIRARTKSSVVESPTVVYLVVGETKYLLASDEVQAKFDKIFGEKVRSKTKIPTESFEKELGPLMAKNGAISRTRIQLISKELGAEVKSKSN